MQQHKQDACQVQQVYNTYVCDFHHGPAQYVSPVQQDASGNGSTTVNLDHGPAF